MAGSVDRQAPQLFDGFLSMAYASMILFQWVQVEVPLEGGIKPHSAQDPLSSSQEVACCHHTGSKGPHSFPSLSPPLSRSFLYPEFLFSKPSLQTNLTGPLQCPWHLSISSSDKAKPQAQVLNKLAWAKQHWTPLVPHPALPLLLLFVAEHFRLAT